MSGTASLPHVERSADVDLHIAATAIGAGDTLVTNDGALLAGDIDGLVAENWI